MKLARWLVFAVLLAALGQDSQWPAFHLRPKLTSDIELQYRYQLARRNPTTQLDDFALQAMDSEQPYWLHLCAQLQHAECLYQFAQTTNEDSVRHNWLIRAAELGHGPSQYQLAVELPQPAGFKWLARAAQQDYPPAVVARFEYAYSQNDDVVTQQWRVKAAKYQWQIALDYAQELLVEQGSDAVKSFLQTLSFAEATEMEGLMNWYESTPQIAFLGRSNLCTMGIQMVTDSLAGTKVMREHYQRLLSDPRLTNLPICLNQPKLLNEDLLSCTNDPMQRLQCKLKPLIDLAQERRFSHAIVIGKQGKANVHNGLMYLDLQDDYDVLVHELAHFAGFVDEYPLAPELAALHCKDARAANLVFAETKPQWQQTHWREYRADSIDGIGLARTCDGSGLQAYKPVSRLTFMEYHELSDIPEIYLQIWRDQLNKPEQLTPIYVNFAQYFDYHQSRETAGYWWAAYEGFRAGGFSSPSSMAD